MLANRPLVVDEGGSSVVTTNCLSATDVDSVPGNLLYTVSNGPSEGHLEMASNPGIPVSEFTQADLAARNLVYVHTSRAENSMDSFIFSVSDGTNDVRNISIKFLILHKLRCMSYDVCLKYREIMMCAIWLMCNT